MHIWPVEQKRKLCNSLALFPKYCFAFRDVLVRWGCGDICAEWRIWQAIRQAAKEGRKQCALLGLRLSCQLQKGRWEQIEADDECIESRRGETRPSVPPIWRISAGSAKNGSNRFTFALHLKNAQPCACSAFTQIIFDNELLEFVWLAVE